MKDRPHAPGLSLGQLLTVGDQTDASGRLLLEDSAPEKARLRATRAGIAMETVDCHYPDLASRQMGVMNVSAYEALRQDTAEVLDGFAWLTANYLRLHPTRRATVQALFDTSQLGISLPLVLFHQAVDPVPAYRRLPTYVASIFKASRGVFSAAVDLRNSCGAPFARTTAAEVVRFADERGHFKRAETGRVCAAPTRLIERALDALIGGQGADPTRSALEGLVDFAILWELCRLQENLGQALSTYRALLDQVTARLGGAASPNALFGAMVAEGGRMRPLGEVTEALAARATAIQGEMNSLLGRRSGPTMGPAMVLALL